ncbi:hypothetical protein D3C87_2001610 [compost metagenome]
MAPTPAGVPVMMMSPGARTNCLDSSAMISGNFQIIWFRLPSCLREPLTSSQIAPSCGWPIFEAGTSAETGADFSNAFATSQERPIFFIWS